MAPIHHAPGIMTTYTYSLPDTLADDIAEFGDDVRRFMDGELAPDLFKAKRVPRGIYEQRHDGTYMMRVRLPGGVLPAPQAAALADICRRHGGAPLHVTTRQDIQLHDLSIEQTPGVMRELFEAGLTCKGGGGNTVRNVSTCAYAGVCPFEVFDVTPPALSVTEHLISLPGSYNLPRKFKIAFSGCGVDCALAEVNDVGFLAKMKDGKPGFILYAGGGMGAESRVANRLSDWIPAEEATHAAEALRRLFSRVGDSRNRKKARLRFAVERMGIEAFREMYEREREEVAADVVPPCPTPERIPAPITPPQPPESLMVVKDGMRVFPQRQAGYVTVPVFPPLGLIRWEDLRTLAHIAEQFSEQSALRAMSSQRLELRFVKESDLSAVRDALSRLSSDLVAPRPIHTFLACAGAATCRLGLCLSRNAAEHCDAALAEEDGLDGEIAKHLDVRISGCPNACGQHPIGTVGLSGVADRVQGRLVPSYEVLLGARRGEGRTRLGSSVGVVPARALPDFMRALFRDYTKNRHPDEPFADYYDRRGQTHFTVLLEPFTAVPAYDVDPSFYRDLGEDDDFSLAGRGPGECGAGVFEIVADDIEAAQRALNESESNPERLYDATLAAARALLITRGIETQDSETVLREFQTQFIQSGLVLADAWYVIDAARTYLASKPVPRAGRKEDVHELMASLIQEAMALRGLMDVRDDIRRLVERVDFLFTKMDPNLRFQVPEAKPAVRERTPSDAGEPEVLDLRGVGCPVNFIRARLYLETMPPDSILHLLLDDGEPATNVPVSLRQEGYEVSPPARESDSHWRTQVRKTT